MALFDTDDGVILTQEGDATRLRAGKKNVLFRKRTPEEIRKEYLKSIKFVREQFEDQWCNVDSELTRDDFFDLTQEIALHHMYFYVVNEFRVRITKKDLSHPQTNSMVWSFMKKKFSDQPDRVNPNCAAFLGISETNFSAWLTGWKLYLEMR